MSLQEKLFADYKQAMINKDSTKKSILNYVIAQIKNKKIEMQKELEDVDVIKIIKKEVKALSEAIGFLEKAGNKQEELEEEKAKKILLEFYLPQTKSKEETKKIVEKIMAEQDITDLSKQRGQLMGAIMGQYGGEVDGSVVNEIVNEML